MPVTPTLSPRVIGQAENAHRPLMNRILARSGTMFPQWVALTKVAADGGTADRRQLIDAMTGALKIDDAAAAEALAGLAAADLLEALEALPGTGSRVGLTPPGQARYREIRAAVDRVTARLYGDIPPAELATACWPSSRPGLTSWPASSGGGAGPAVSPRPGRSRPARRRTSWAGPTRW